MKSLWYVTNMLKCHVVGCAEHGLKYITCYVQKHVAPSAVFSGPYQASDGPLGHPHL